MSENKHSLNEKGKGAQDTGKEHVRRRLVNVLITSGVAG